MSRWIDAEWLMNFFTDIPDNFTLTIGNLRATVNEAPSIDIVRCRECKHYEDPDHKIFENCVKWKDSNGIILPMKPNDSCSYGERVDEYEKEYRELGLGKLKALRQAERSSE